MPLSPTDPFWAPLERDLVSVEGPDAVAFLQGQLSQDVAGLAVGASALAFLLEPQGRVLAVTRITRRAADHVWVDVEGGQGEAVLARLSRFKLRTKADLALVPDVRWVAVRGTTAAAVEGVEALAPCWPGIVGTDLVGADPAAALPAGLRQGDAADLARSRVEALAPSAAIDLDERALVHEIGGVAEGVSFTKGCYTGQELVARMDSRGATAPRTLHRVVGPGGAPSVGAEVVSAAGATLGRLTTLVALDGSWAGLGLLGRAAQAGADVTVDGASATIDA